MDDAALRQLAVDAVEGRVFGSWNLQSADELPMVFLPLALMRPEQAEKMADIAQVYESLDKAGPRSVNGLPCFFSMQMLTRAEWEALVPLIKERVAERSAFLGATEART